MADVFDVPNLGNNNQAMIDYQTAKNAPRQTGANEVTALLRSAPTSTSAPTATDYQPATFTTETIQIAPHPTTNRFPWAPIENPTVVVQTAAAYQPVPKPQPVFVPPPVYADAPVLIVQTPPPPLLVDNPQIIPMPQRPPNQPPPIIVFPPRAPTLPIDPPPIQPLTPMPMPLAVLQVQPPLPVRPVAPIEVTLSLAKPSIRPVLSAGTNTSTITMADSSATPPKRLGPQPAHIYSEYTKEAWGVFRPNTLLRILKLGFVLLVVGATVGLWMYSGKPTSIQNIPFVQLILNAQ